MGRKKKIEVKKEYTPSKYQEAIFDYIQNGNGNLVIEACAGAGKTTTIIKSLEYIPRTKRILLSAFNKDIVTELKKRTKEFDNVNVSTLHSLGYSFLKNNFPQKMLSIQDFKYQTLIKDNVSELSSINTYVLRGKRYFKYIDNIIKYVNYGRHYLCHKVSDLDFIEERYEIDTMADEKEFAIKAMELGKNDLDNIDFIDMIWLPNVLDLKPVYETYDYIFVDECQDMNVAERELVLRCFNENTRMISVGDEKQAIYGFAGSDYESFKALKSMENTICLPLSISYRCASKIVDFAKKIVPSIESNDDGRDGTIIPNVRLEDIKEGDMVLCRNNAPLVQAYNLLLKLDKKAYIRGKDIGSNLKSLIRSTAQPLLNVDCNNDGVFVRLYEDLFTTRNKIMSKYGIDEITAMKNSQIQNKIDIIKAIEILSEGMTSADEVIERIDKIFKSSSKSEGIALSTIHKAKGLEADRVFILCDSLMPSKSASKDWEIRQEYNLMYVAYTRPKNVLGFVDESLFKDFDFSNTLNLSILKNIERKVNLILRKPTKLILNKDNAKQIISKAKKIDKNKLTNKSVQMEATRGKRSINSFSDVLKKHKKIKL